MKRILSFIMVMGLLNPVSLNAFKVKNPDGDVVLYIGGTHNDRISINCGENIDENYALKVCGKITADDFVKDTVTLDFKDSDDTIDGNETNSDHDAVITLTLNKASSNDVSFHFETKDNSASDGSDYDKVDSDFTIPAGDTSIDIKIKIYGDTTEEGDEKIDIEITNVNNADLADSTADYTILNDDTTPKVELKDSSYTDDEGTSFTVNYTVSQAVSGDVDIDWEIAHDTTDDADFDNCALSGTFTIADGTDSGSFTVDTNDDNNFGDQEHFQVKLTNVSSGTANLGSDKIQDIYINNNDSEPKATIDDQEVDETGDDQDVDFTISLDVAPETTVKLTAEIEHDTTDNDDVDPDEGDQSTITFNSGDDSKVFTVTVKGDDDEEDDETYFVKLKNADGITIDDDTGDGKINNDDSSGYFSDRRLKTDILTIVRPFDKINNLRGVTFKWKDTGKSDYGFIAQEIQQELPNSVSKDKSGYYRVQYYETVPLLLEGIKVLKQENILLRNKLNELSSRLKVIEGKK